LSYLIGRLDRLISKRLKQALAPLGLTVGQYTVLSVFRAYGHMSNAQLAERSLISPQSANEMVNLMEQRGWICRRPEDTRGRVIPIGLTPEGEALMTRCDAEVNAIEDELMKGLGDDEFWHLHGGLRALVRLLRAH
jgi:DNA-binding MarR family transcriptional regulator